MSPLVAPRTVNLSQAHKKSPKHSTSGEHRAEAPPATKAIFSIWGCYRLSSSLKLTAVPALKIGPEPTPRKKNVDFTQAPFFRDELLVSGVYHPQLKFTQISKSIFKEFPYTADCCWSFRYIQATKKNGYPLVTSTMVKSRLKKQKMVIPPEGILIAVVFFTPIWIGLMSKNPYHRGTMGVDRPYHIYRLVGGFNPFEKY